MTPEMITAGRSIPRLDERRRRERYHQRRGGGGCGSAVRDHVDALLQRHGGFICRLIVSSFRTLIPLCARS